MAATGARVRVPVAVACRVLGLTTQGYYKWLNGPVSQRDWDDAHVIHALHEIHEDEPTLGYRFLTDELEDVGIVASENRVQRLCSMAGIHASHAKKKGKAGKPGPPVHDDLLAVVDEKGRVRHEFAAAAPNEVWLTDIERHEALLNRAVVKGHRLRSVAADRVKLRAARPRRREGGWQAALTTTGRASTARWSGSGKQDGKAYVRNQRLNAPQETLQLEPGGSGLVSSAHPDGTPDGVVVRGTLGPVEVAGREATVNACGVAVAMLQGHSWAPTPSNGSTVNVGTISAVPSPVSNLLVGGKVRRRLTPPRWGGGPVVVRGRESRPHGEGVQRVRSNRAVSGVRW